MTNFWEFSVWDTLIGIFILMLFLLIAELIRKIPFVAKSLLPTSVIGGILLLITKELWPWFNNLIHTDMMGILTYHMLALGFIATTLKTNTGKSKSNANTVLCTGIVTCNSYILQAIIGLLVTIPLSLCITGLVPFAGLLLPMGFGQGTGQAYNWGSIYENQHNFVGGTTFGLSIAAVGFIVACVIGVAYLTYLKRKGKIKITKSTAKNYEIISEDNEEPNNEAVDKLTIQLMLILTIYFITYGLMGGLSVLSKPLGDFSTKTLIPLIWGFNFLFGTVIAVLFKSIINKLVNKKIIKYRPTNNYLLKRLSGSFFDIMIVAGVAAIDLTQLKALWIPLLVMGFFGTIGTFAYVKYVSKYLWKGYENEATLSMFGMLTGTASTGMILLREIDEDFLTPASDDLVYQQVPAIGFGFPVLLLLSFGAQEVLKLGSKEYNIQLGGIPINVYITLLILVILFFVYNAIIYFIRKHKKVQD